MEKRPVRIGKNMDCCQFSGMEKQRSGEMKRHSDAAWLFLLLGIAALLRFYNLGEAPFHHDESIHAWFSYMLFTGKPYRFDPVYHGPFLYWSNALIYSIMGDSDFTARFLPALFSTGLILLCFSMRRHLGRQGWIAASLFIVFSPTMTFYGRFLAHDNYVAFFTLSLPALALIWGRTKHPAFIWLAGAALGFFISTKACFYIHICIFAGFGVAAMLLNSFGPEYPAGFLFRRALSETVKNRWHLAGAMFSFLLLYVAFYSSFFEHWQGVADGITKTLAYWGGQQLHPRLPGPFWYYLPRLFIHEPAVYLAVPALFSMAAKKRRPFDTFLAFWTLASFLLYSIAQEKVPWLMMHIVLPMTLLAGRYVQEIWQGGKHGPWITIALCILISWSARDSVRLCFTSPPSAPHLLKFMASTEDVKETAGMIIKSELGEMGDVFVTGRPVWPLAWYLRRQDVTYAMPPDGKKASVIIADSSGMIDSGQFACSEKILGTWWTPDYRKLITSDLLSYLVELKTDEPSGSFRFVECVRKH
jgi:uncharacterized protein (TIGR03663 family)